MPFADGVFSRIWKFVDRFTTSDAVARADLDTACDDLAAGINGAVTYLEAEIEELAAGGLYLGRLAEEPTTNNVGGALVAGNSYILSSTNVLYVYDGTDWQKEGDLGFASDYFKGLVDVEDAAAMRAALELGTAATATLSTLATGNDLNAESALTRATRQIHTTGGTGDAFSIVTNTPITAYAAWQVFLVRFNRAPTGAATLNVDSQGARAIKKMNAAGSLVDIAADDWRAGDHDFLVNDGTQFVLLKNYVKPPKDDETLADEADDEAVSERAVKAYVDGEVAAVGLGFEPGAVPVATPRADNTSYQNTTGFHMPVFIPGQAQGGTMQLSSDNSTWQTVVSHGSGFGPSFTIVPPGWYYRANLTAASIVEYRAP